MVKISIGLCICLILAPVHGAGDRSAVPIKIALSDDFEPWSWEAGPSVKGLARDILEQILTTRMRLAPQFSGYPWARAQALSFEGQADAICTAITGKRLEYLIASKQPVVSIPIRIFARKDSSLLARLAGIKDLASLNAAPVHFLTYTGAGWASQNLDSTKTDMTGNLSQVLDKLAYGRGDVVVENSAVVRSAIARKNLQDRIVELPLDLDSLRFHLLINRRSRFAKDLSEFDLQMAQFRKSKAYRTILGNYGL